MIAQVIVNTQSSYTDKKFDYLIPRELINKITLGTRVYVPFGRGNKRLEGYVVAISDNTSVSKLKAISDADDIPVFNGQMIELIEWMRESYFCSYIDAIRAIVPTGTSVKSIEYAVLKDHNLKISPKEKRVVDIVLKKGGSCDVIDILSQFEDENIKPVIKRLYDKGVLEKQYRDTRTVKDKTVKIVKSTVDPEDFGECIQMLNKTRAVAQVKVMEVLSRTDIISLSDLLMISQCGYNTVAALKKRGLIEFEEKIVLRSHKNISDIVPNKPPVLTCEQELAAKEIDKAISSQKFNEILLHGVTGSGKTEVYMNAIERVIEQGKQAIMLVPEISLTPQMMERFINRFGEKVAVFHSGLSLGEKYDEWKKMRDKKASIVIGARSAIFAPFDNIGIIIIDEEHELSYKSEMQPRYDTKEVAKYRAMQNNCTLIYASATPDIKTYYNAKNEKIKLLELNKRVNKRPIPEVSIVDMRNELKDGNKSIFSKKLLEEIKINLDNKEQTILFLNRRGFSTFVSCRNCGFVAYCPNCNISLTYHKYNNTLRCHYCGHTVKNYTVCPKCSSKYIRYFGGGTQRVEDEIKEYFPNASTIRMDVDTTVGQNSHEKLLYEFEKNKTDILIGTQMVAKGLDFPNVTLVGVVSADTMLNIEDFRSAERSFDLLEQVSGRAGRAEKKGRAIIQTYSPEHSAVVSASKHEYLKFYEREIQLRKSMNYPPFCDLVSVLFSGTNEPIVAQCARFFAKEIIGIKNKDKSVQILGPVPAAITKVKNKFRWRILIKCKDANLLTEKLSSAAEECEKNNNFEKVIIVIDKNPNNIN